MRCTCSVQLSYNCSAERVASSDPVEFGVAKGSRSCHVDLPRVVTRDRARACVGTV